MTNQEYIKARNKLAEQAEKIANSAHGKNPPGRNNEVWHFNWSRTFHAEMDKLCVGLGERKAKK
jgi:hypothetical protein